MPAFEISTFINRPPQLVFDFATDPANAPKWQTGTKKALLSVFSACPRPF
jgi:uncharacterized protein YndB with AHSA1/START domain